MLLPFQSHLQPKGNSSQTVFGVGYEYVVDFVRQQALCSPARNGRRQSMIFWVVVMTLWGTFLSDNAQVAKQTQRQ